jgi:hypothetical protein
MSYLCHVHGDQENQQCLHCQDVKKRNSKYDIIEDYISLAQMRLERHYREIVSNK